MAIVAIDAGLFCLGRQVADGVQERLCAAELTDEQLFAIAAKTSGVAASRLEKLLYGPRSLLDGVRRDRARLVAHLRAAVAETFGSVESRVYLGRAGHLVPPALTHVLKVCLGGTHDSRLRQAEAEGVSKRDAQRQISKDDELRADACGGLVANGLSAASADHMGRPRERGGAVRHRGSRLHVPTSARGRIQVRKGAVHG